MGLWSWLFGKKAKPRAQESTGSRERPSPTSDQREATTRSAPDSEESEDRPPRGGDDDVIDADSEVKE
jgi:hypothetical protein